MARYLLLGNVVQTHHCPSVKGAPKNSDDSKMDRNCLVVMIMANTRAPKLLMV
jgi:hypothetical protein